MKINWKVRFKNPAFWVQVVVAIFVPMLAYFGLNWSDMTTWAAIGQVLIDAVKNPVVMLSAAVSVWNAATDPTTKGFGDSARALNYTTPGGDE